MKEILFDNFEIKINNIKYLILLILLFFWYLLINFDLSYAWTIEKNYNIWEEFTWSNSNYIWKISKKDM